MADGGVLVAKLEKGRSPAVIPKRGGKLDLGRSFEKPEALSFNFAGKECARSNAEEGGIAVSMATERPASRGVDVPIADAPSFAADIADRLRFVTALMANPITEGWSMLERG